MARHIDADRVMEEIASMGGHDLCEWSTLGVKALIDRQPTADVAPRAEVAREIFEEIRDLIRFTMEPCGTTLYAKIEFEKLEAIRKKYRDPEPPKGDHNE